MEHIEPLPRLCDVRGDRCCGTPACENAGKWAAERDEGVIVCAGCGATTTADVRDGWRITDAAWCPKCAWLA